MDYIGLMAKSLDVSKLKTSVIADNITNFNTPMYKAKQVDDNAVFSLSSFAPMKKTNSKHMDGGSQMLGEASVFTRTDTKERPDGNNVDMNTEMVNLVKANSTYQKAVEAVNREFAIRKMSIGS